MPIAHFQNTSPLKQFLARHFAKLVAIGAFVVLSLISLTIIYQNYQAQKQRLINYSASLSQNSFNSSKEALSLTARSIFISAIFKDEIFKLMAEAYHGDQATRDAVRRELYLKLYPTYQMLRNENLRQLHFHLPNAVSFLRFHRPDKFGDDLSGVRPTIMAVNQTREPVTGFEEGRIYNGFRHVYPIRYKNEFVGTVEISFSVDSIFELVLHNHVEYSAILLKRKAIEQKVFADELSNYEASTIDDDLLRDKKIKGFHAGTATLDENTLQQINAAIRPQFQRNCERCSFVTQIGAKHYLTHLYSLQDFTGQKIGYIVNYHEEPALGTLNKSYLEVLAVNEVLLLLISGLIFFYARSLMSQQQTLKRLANIDSLTGVLNRHAFKKALHENMAKNRAHNNPLSVIFFDIDHFKSINDNHGHLMGDEVLKYLTLLIRDGITHNDIFARWGGEEFVILLPNTSFTVAQTIAERLRKRIELQQHFSFTITSSFGVTSLRDDDSTESLLQRADQLLYDSKRLGRNCITAHT
ncbi:sensor domain-containing diguanylate cyclase [Thiomicrorhabdus cannonii]|uniref:sensor domain-containing diguanylate cyclase n=1 Tax=Thiomicrorhabdus cannonii TaxID=2748011 RepID=UPI0015BE445A|nr:diguanylate cyclase [Thiomicrorhabdus cannonii]